MNIVLLSGGSGKRLWPLSNDVRSKQFIKIFQKSTGEYESMVQRVYSQIKKVDNASKVVIATAKTQVSSIQNQLGTNVSMSIEPCRRDTFPAIVLATAYMVDVLGIKENEPIIVCPVDPYVEDTYFDTLKELESQVRKDEANLVLMGIEPSYPSEKYGYIIPEKNEHVSDVLTFKEKPDKTSAARYIEQGALWNGGVFAYKSGFVLDKARELIGYTGYQELYDRYGTLDKISFDYAVVEHEKKIQVVRYQGEWKDLGTWNTLTEAVADNVIGKGVQGSKCKNVNIVNELDIPILAMGLDNIVISASPDGILVSDKEQSSYIKPYADKFVDDIRFAEKSWGSYKVLYCEKESITILVTLNKGSSMNYHSHARRDEVWTIIEGRGRTIVDGMEQCVTAGDVITMAAGCRHTIIAEEDMKVIEVQLGKEIRFDDKTVFRLE